MKPAPHIADPIAEEAPGDDLTAKLFEHFAPLRPDPDEFAAGVRHRIDQPRTSRVRLPAYLRAAAALLPPFLLPKGLTAGVAGAAGSKVGLKVVPGLVALPVATLAMLLLTVFLVVRGLFGHGAVDPQRADRRSAATEVADWWKQHALVAAVVLIGLFALVLVMPVEAVTALLLLSTLTLFLLWNRLAAAGLAGRDEIGRRAGVALLMIASTAFQFTVNPAFGLDDQFGLVLVVPGLVLTGVSCLFLARPRDTATHPMRWVIVLVLILGGWIGALAVHRQFGRTPVTAAEVATWLEADPTATAANPDPACPDPARVAQTLRHLRAAGARIPDLANLRTWLHAQLDASYPDGLFHRIAATAVVELGMARPEDYARWHDDYREGRVLDPAQRPPRDDQDRLPIYVYAFEHGLDDRQRAFLADRVVEGVLQPRRYDQIEDLVGNAVLLDQLGRTADQEHLRGRAHELLLASMATSADGRSAAFSPYRLADYAKPVDTHRLTFIWLDATSAAVEAMDRFGVPDGIDLIAVGRYLDDQRQRYRRAEVTDQCVLAAAALQRLQAMPAYRAAAARPGALLAQLAGLRVLAATVLLSAFALLATLRAPVAPTHASRAT